jgi:hypothetical protein
MGMSSRILDFTSDEHMPRRPRDRRRKIRYRARQESPGSARRKGGQKQDGEQPLPGFHQYGISFDLAQSVDPALVQGSGSANSMGYNTAFMQGLKIEKSY